MARFAQLTLVLAATLFILGSALAAPAPDAPTAAQQAVVDQLNAYRQQLDAANAKWQADVQAALAKGESPPPFPDVPTPTLTAPGYDSTDPAVAPPANTDAASPPPPPPPAGTDVAPPPPATTDVPADDPAPAPTPADDDPEAAAAAAAALVEAPTTIANDENDL